MSGIRISASEVHSGTALHRLKVCHWSSPLISRTAFGPRRYLVEWTFWTKWVCYKRTVVTTATNAALLLAHFTSHAKVPFVSLKGSSEGGIKCWALANFRRFYNTIILALRSTLFIRTLLETLSHTVKKLLAFDNIPYVHSLITVFTPHHTRLECPHNMYRNKIIT
jgi:hypothetical protein